MKMQPTDQISIAAVYSEQLSSNSGARYHRVTTYSVMKSVSEVVLASPKSQILRSQFALSSRLLGFKSRCKTLAECMYFSPRSNWYRKYCRSHWTMSTSVISKFHLVETSLRKYSIILYWTTLVEKQIDKHRRNTSKWAEQQGSINRFNSPRSFAWILLGIWVRQKHSYFLIFSRKNLNSQNSLLSFEEAIQEKTTIWHASEGWNCSLQALSDVVNIYSKHFFISSILR